MKKLMTITALFCATSSFAACDADKLIPESKLPEQSRTFLRTHFADVPIVSIVKEIDGLEKDYTVYLKNGFEVDFTRSGAWDEVEGHTNALPASVVGLLPAGIPSYVDENFAGRPITKVNKEHYGFDVGLADGTDLEFTSTGEFFRYDD